MHIIYTTEFNLLCTSQCEPPDNPGDFDSFLTSHPDGYDNGVQTQR